jgi:ureidoacrylate peracid hydrolase
MHRIDIPKWISDRVMDRRGTLHAFADFDPRKTALVVIDMQNCFLDPAVAASAVPIALEIIPNINKLAAAVREADGKVFWTLHTVTDKTLTDLSNWFGLFRATPEQVRIRAKNMAPGSYGHALHAKMDVRPEDVMVMKTRFSAFWPESCDLSEQLRHRGIDTVLVAGTATNVCCETSARDAMMLNFKVIMVSDATATWTDAEHNASLANIYSIFGDVMDVQFIMDRLKTHAGGQFAPALQA